MSKLTRRVLSMVMAVFMLISMISVFTLPAFAEEAAATDVIDYDAKFETAYIIDKSWTDDQLAGTEDLTFTFRGEEKTVNPTTHKLFNNFEDARADAFATGKVNAENYFTYLPVFVFSAADYSADGNVNIPAPAYVWGANAGINPNADIDAQSRDVAWIQANGGWPANENRGAETTLGMVILSTRKAIPGTLYTGTMVYESADITYLDAEGNKVNDAVTKETYTDEDSQWQYFMDQGFLANPDAEANIYVDGAKITKVSITNTDYNNNHKYYYQGKQYTANVSKDKKSIFYVDNCIPTITMFLQAWNTTWFWQEAVVTNMRCTMNLQFGDRYFDKITINDSYFTGITAWGPFFKNFAHTGIHRTEGQVDMNRCVVYETAGNTFAWHADDNHVNMTKFTFNLKDSLLYNVGKSSWGDFVIYSHQVNDDGKTNTKATASDKETVIFNIQDNIIYDDSSKITLFNGNAN